MKSEGNNAETNKEEKKGRNQVIVYMQLTLNISPTNNPYLIEEGSKRESEDVS